jgi:hypothetical protein
MSTLGSSTVSVEGTCASPVVINQEGPHGGPGDRVFVGNGANGLQDIQGQLTIENTPALNTITVDDTADPMFHTASLDTFGADPFGRITGLTPLGTPIQYECADTSSVTIKTSAVNGNVVNVLKTCVSTTLSGNGTAADLTIVNVGNAANGVQDILGTLNVNNVPSYTQLNLDDSGYPGGGRNAVLSADNVAGRVHNLAPADIIYSTAASDVSGLTIYGSNSGSNTFCILSTYQFTPVTIHTGMFGDTVNIGNSANGLSAIQSTVNMVSAFAFSDAINLINVAGTNHTYNVNPNDVTDATLGRFVVTFRNPPWQLQYWNNAADAWFDFTGGLFPVVPGWPAPPPC